MARFHRLRLLTCLTALLFVAAATAYAAHHHGDADRSHAAEHCDLCLQFGAAAGTPAAPAPVPASSAPSYALPPGAGGVIPGRRFLHSLQARAPPQAPHG